MGNGMEECKCGWYVKRGVRNCPQCGIEIDPQAAPVIFDRPGAPLPPRIGQAALRAAQTAHSQETKEASQGTRSQAPAASSHRSAPKKSVVLSTITQPRPITALVVRTSISLQPVAPRQTGRVGPSHPPTQTSAFCLVERDQSGNEREHLRSASFPTPADSFETAALRDHLDKFRREVKQADWITELPPKPFQPWYCYRYERSKGRIRT